MYPLQCVVFTPSPYSTCATLVESPCIGKKNRAAIAEDGLKCAEENAARHVFLPDGARSDGVVFHVSDS